MKQLIATVLAVCLLTHASLADEQENAELRFAKILGDNMVLQQDKPITVWGWAEPGADVEVTLTQDRELGEQRVAASGVEVPSGEVDEGYSVTIQYVDWYRIDARAGGNSYSWDVANGRAQCVGPSGLRKNGWGGCRIPGPHGPGYFLSPLRGCSPEASSGTRFVRRIRDWPLSSRPSTQGRW